MEISFYEFVLKKIRINQEKYKERILTGALSELDYKLLSGKLFGLIEAEELVKEAYRNLYENKIKE